MEFTPLGIKERETPGRADEWQMSYFHLWGLRMLTLIHMSAESLCDWNVWETTSREKKKEREEKREWECLDGSAPAALPHYVSGPHIFRWNDPHIQLYTSFTQHAYGIAGVASTKYIVAYMPPTLNSLLSLSFFPSLFLLRTSQEVLFSNTKPNI